ncbi:hypothetical protein ColTof3_05063 [Colletotrichum tofieldiae]|nr:hypothetical protein ColTof3_05063 [Colletotrichum tofieldiae]
MLEQSFITAACFASLHLQRIPFAPSLQVKSYQSPFGLYDPSHFVTLLLRGIEHGSPSFYASVAVIDLDIPWQNIGLFIGNGIRRKAKDAIMAAQGQAQPRENQSPALTIAFINTGINEQLTPGRLREATSIQSSSGPAIASGVGPYGPSCLSPPSRTASRIEVTPLGTPVEAHSSTTPTSFGLEVLSRCSKDAQRYGKFELVSHDSHETPQDKVHLEE